MRIEWPTLALIALCYGAWCMGTTWLAAAALWLAIPITGLAVALFSSLQHEVIHGHPFRARWLNEALVFPALTLAVPFVRFRDSHLDHHVNADLTDPYDDPESNYLDPEVWAGLPIWVQRVLLFNNTLAGRMLIGALISQIAFMLGDLRRAGFGDRRIIGGWLWHIPALVPVFAWLIWVGSMPLWGYILAAYIGLSLIKVRTFLEHQAHERASGRTAIVEARGLFGLLFLNNNLHVVHHAHPAVPWYRLPKLYRARKERFHAQNGGYVYASYTEVFRRHLFRRKDPVPHPRLR
ncbi:Fatty acid desaturase family protein [Candidatus Rhodobacter oscarellae]|uniref:Fatty acid desaturase family protein n=1 Tax=Candidatus Rhodobacter oscarellae TaxID=1675527 RepID=A0A0J9EBR8_9RHOB|nr:fatty acid desaturase [Candidatus Rhodobacter lobularis]KMW60207.1 Fatty acid desaturase family protein [Candidatus Rhodobacter lobularis]